MSNDAREYQTRDIWGRCKVEIEKKEINNVADAHNDYIMQASPLFCRFTFFCEAMIVVVIIVVLQIGERRCKTVLKNLQSCKKIHSIIY